MMNPKLQHIVAQFKLEGTVDTIEPLGNGLINDTYKVTTQEPECPDYVLQRINHLIFQDIDLLQHNIEAVTRHIRRKLETKGTTDIDRKVLTFVSAKDSNKTFWYDGENYWRISVFIPRSKTYELVDPAYSRFAGAAFGNFQAMLTDIPEKLEETIPDFHNMEFRMQQLHEAIAHNVAGRLTEVQDLVNELENRATTMCQAERLYREGKLPKRICHCDTKVNNMLFDEDGKVLCVIDLDTVMPSFIFSDYGDFLRTAANTAPEDEPDLSKIHFRMDIFEAFTEGYLESARCFLTPLEIELLPYAVALFPYMQTVRFLTDYLNGDTYYKIQYPLHNKVRSLAQFRLLECVEEQTPAIQAFIQKQLA